MIKAIITSVFTFAILLAVSSKSMADEDIAALVVDNGSGMCTAGFSGDNPSSPAFCNGDIPAKALHTSALNGPVIQKKTATPNAKESQLANGRPADNKYPSGNAITTQKPGESKAN